MAHRTPKPPAPPPAGVLARHGCTLRHVPSAGHKHVNADKAYAIRYVQPAAIAKNPDGSTVFYDSFPPTSGPHSPRWMPWGTYAVPVPEIRAVHNLEHGGIVIQWGRDVPGAVVTRIRRFAAASPNGMLLAPLPALGSRIALTAWTYLATCAGFDPVGFATFRDALRFKGPERFPASALAPGR